MLALSVCELLCLRIFNGTSKTESVKGTFFIVVFSTEANNDLEIQKTFETLYTYSRLNIFYQEFLLPHILKKF